MKLFFIQKIPSNPMHGLAPVYHLQKIGSGDEAAEIQVFVPF